MDRLGTLRMRRAVDKAISKLDLKRNARRLQDGLGEAEVGYVISQLRKLRLTSEKRRLIQELEKRFKDNNFRRDLGLQTYEQYSVEWNRIVYEILEMISK